MFPTHHKKRPDAMNIGGELPRDYVPTTPETKWLDDWSEFEAAGGVMHFNEDQTEIVLTLPPPYKFGIKFQRP